jgi:hypothetical protein
MSTQAGGGASGFPQDCSDSSQGQRQEAGVERSAGSETSSPPALPLRRGHAAAADDDDDDSDDDGDTAPSSLRRASQGRKAGGVAQGRPAQSGAGARSAGGGRPGYGHRSAAGGQGRGEGMTLDPKP